MAAINLDQDHKVRTMAVSKVSILTCVSTSGDAVFVRGSTESTQNELLAGDSIVVKEDATLVVRIFCTNPAATKFSASLTLQSKPAAKVAHLEAMRTMLSLPTADTKPAARAAKAKKRKG